MNTKVVCYYTNWSQYRPNGGKFVPEDIDISLCDFIVYAFAKIEAGVLAPFEWNDDSTEWSKGMYERVNDLKKLKPGLKTLLAVGGWNMGSAPFTEVVAKETSRRKFNEHAIEYLRKRHFDGLDIDWEYPGSRGSPPEDRERFSLWLKELRESFEQEAFRTSRDRLLLTVAVPAGKEKIDAGYEVDKVARCVDFLNLMTYDLHGSWEQFTGLVSPLYPRRDESGIQATLNQDWAVRYWMQKGAPAETLIMGLPTYGRTFTLVNPERHGLGDGAQSAGVAGEYTREAGFLSYYEIEKRLQTGWTYVWSDEQKAPYAYYNNQWVGYEDQNSLRMKAKYVQDLRLGGVMVWSFDLDDFKGAFGHHGTYPLLKTLNTPP